MAVEQTTRIDGKTCGLIFMAFGVKAGASVSRSIFSLQRLGVSYPVTVVGDRRVMGTNFLEWTGESPFDTSQRTNFKFRAGRVKPLLYQCSPYEWTMYLDADAVFMKTVEEGFRHLEKFDMVVTEEKLNLAELYNKHLAGWEINLAERDVSVVETGGDDQQKFINSGVFFFRKSKAVAKVFDDWYKEWMRFQQWDEQLSLMRSLYANPKVKVKRLPVAWNAPHLYTEDIRIYHPYGRGNIRANPI